MDAPAGIKAEPTQARLAREYKHTSPLLGCRVDPSGKCVFAGAQDNRVLRWELETGKKTALSGHKSWVRGLAFAGKYLLSGDYHGRLLWWPLDAGDGAPEPARNIEAHAGALQALAVSPNGQLVTTGGNDGVVRLWSVADGTLVHELPGHEEPVWNVAFHPDGKQLVSADHKGVVKVWDVAGGKARRDLDASALYKYDTKFRAAGGGVRSLVFSADGSRLLAAGAINWTNTLGGICNPGAVLFDWASGKQVQLLLAKEAFTGPMWGAAWHSAGFWVGTGLGPAVAGGGGALWFWKGDQGPAFHTVKLPQGGRDLSLLPDGLRLAVAHADGAVRLYDLAAKAAMP
ncbi:MAG: WD40 repeat domain-containing protein [Gemmataceae bacterium]|nr:WD40 repeat domain-containing protein [Gemmataceae bacterium]